MKNKLFIILIVLLAVALISCETPKSGISPEKEEAQNSDPVLLNGEDTPIKPDEETPVEPGEKVLYELDDMPAPFAEGAYGTGGDEKTNYYSPFVSVFGGVSVKLIRLVDQKEFDDWIANNSNSNPANPSIHGKTNIYSFATKFGISNDEIADALKVYLNPISDNPPQMTKEELDVILSRDEAAIIDAFKTDHTIGIENRVYTPQWLYENTLEAYAAEGITPEAVLERIALYSNIPLSSEAAKAFQEKLGEFTGSDVVLLRAVMVEAEHKSFDSDWLISHTIQDYKANGITVEHLESYLEKISIYPDSYTYSYVNSAYLRMKEDMGG